MKKLKRPLSSKELRQIESIASKLGISADRYIDIVLSRIAREGVDPRFLLTRPAVRIAQDAIRALKCGKIHQASKIDRDRVLFQQYLESYGSEKSAFIHASPFLTRSGAYRILQSLNIDRKSKDDLWEFYNQINGRGEGDDGIR